MRRAPPLSPTPYVAPAPAPAEPGRAPGPIPPSVRRLAAEKGLDLSRIDASDAAITMAARYDPDDPRPEHVRDHRHGDAIEQNQWLAVALALMIESDWFVAHAAGSPVGMSKSIDLAAMNVLSVGKKTSGRSM